MLNTLTAKAVKGVMNAPPQLIAPPPSAATTISQKIFADIRLAEKVFQEDRIVEAYFLFLSVERFLESVKEEEIVSQVRTYINSSSTIAKMIEKGHALHKVLVSFDKASLWSTWNEKLGPHQDVTMYIHKDTPEGQYSFKTEGFLRNSGIIEVAAAILENRLFKYWMPMCTECKVLATESGYRRIIQLDFDFVLLKKIAVVAVRGDVLPDGRLFLSFEPLLEEDDLTLRFLPHNKEIRMELFGAVLLTEEAIIEKPEKHQLEDLVEYVTSRQPVHQANADYKSEDIDHDNGDEDDRITSPTRESFFGVENSKLASTTKAVKTQLIVRADLKIDFIPDWIFNLGVRSTTSMVIPMLEHQATLFGRGEVHRPLMESNAAVYELIEMRLKDYEGRPNPIPPLVKRKLPKKVVKEKLLPIEENPLHASDGDLLPAPVRGDSVASVPVGGKGSAPRPPPPLLTLL